MDQIQTEVPERTVSTSGGREITTAMVAPSADPPAAAVTPQVCANCGAAPAINGGARTTPNYIYVIGGIKAVSPSPSVEKEFAQATGRAETAGPTDRQAISAHWSLRWHSVVPQKKDPSAKISLKEQPRVSAPKGLKSLDQPVDKPSPKSFNATEGARKPNAR